MTITQVGRLSAVCMILPLATSCTTFDVFDSTALAGFEKAESSQEFLFHGSYWGFSWSDTDHIPCNESCRGMHTVSTGRCLLYDIAPIFTLGLWAPTTMEIWCWVEAEDDGDSTSTTLPTEHPTRSRAGR